MRIVDHSISKWHYKIDQVHLVEEAGRRGEEDQERGSHSGSHNRYASTVPQGATPMLLGEPVGKHGVRHVI